MDTPLCETSIPSGLPSFGDAVDGSPIVRSINIIKSIRKQKTIARGGPFRQTGDRRVISTR